MECKWVGWNGEGGSRLHTYKQYKKLFSRQIRYYCSKCGCSDISEAEFKTWEKMKVMRDAALEEYYKCL